VVVRQIASHHEQEPIMSNYGTNIYAAQRIAQYRTDERIRDAEQARTARAFRRVKPESGPTPRARRGFGFAWAVRRAVV
jgi:hypothetical protein